MAMSREVTDTADRTRTKGRKNATVFPTISCAAGFSNQAKIETGGLAPHTGTKTKVPNACAPASSANARARIQAMPWPRSIRRFIAVPAFPCARRSATQVNRARLTLGSSGGVQRQGLHAVVRIRVAEFRSGSPAC